MTTPVRLVAIGIYDEKGNLRRRIAVDESGQLEEIRAQLERRKA